MLLNFWLHLVLFELFGCVNSISWTYCNGDCANACDFSKFDFATVYALNLDDCVMTCYQSVQTCTNFEYYDDYTYNFGYKYYCYLKNGNKNKTDAESDKVGNKYCGLRPTCKYINGFIVLKLCIIIISFIYLI